MDTCMNKIYTTDVRVDFVSFNKIEEYGAKAKEETYKDTKNAINKTSTKGAETDIPICKAKNNNLCIDMFDVDDKNKEVKLKDGFSKDDLFDNMRKARKSGIGFSIDKNHYELYNSVKEGLTNLEKSSIK